jgi:hypothetical protein
MHGDDNRDNDDSVANRKAMMDGMVSGQYILTTNLVMMVMMVCFRVNSQAPLSGANKANEWSNKPFSVAFIMEDKGRGLLQSSNENNA